MMCPKRFELQYIKHFKGDGRLYTEYGKFIHSTLEQNAKGENEELKKQIKEKFPEFPDEDIDRILRIVDNLEDMQKWLDKYNIKD